MEQQKVDLDALEAALGKSTPGEWGEHMKLYNRDGFRLVQEDMDCIVSAHNALPALIAELRQLRARTTPEPIGEKHKDGNWWMVWDENIGAWCKARWVLGCGQWDLEGYVWFERTPTHALPLPLAPEAQ